MENTTREQLEIEQLLEDYKSKVFFAGAKNKIIKRAESLINNTKPNPERLFVMEGIWAFNVAFEAGLEMRDFIFCPECVYSLEALELARKAMATADKIHVISQRVAERISERDKPDGLIAICKKQEHDLSAIKTKDAVIVVLDGVEIPGNIGTILRSCDGADIDAVFIVNRRARLTHPKLIKGSMGAVFFKPVIEFETVAACKSWLAEHGFTIYLADTRAEKTYRDYDYNGNVALVAGSERYGITKEWYEDSPELLSIPMLGRCDSLNVAIASTMILYEIRLKKMEGEV